MEENNDSCPNLHHPLWGVPFLTKGKKFGHVESSINFIHNSNT